AVPTPGPGLLRPRAARPPPSRGGRAHAGTAPRRRRRAPSTAPPRPAVRRARCPGWARAPTLGADPGDARTVIGVSWRTRGRVPGVVAVLLATVLLSGCGTDGYEP